MRERKLSQKLLQNGCTNIISQIEKHVINDQIFVLYNNIWFDGQNVILVF